LTITFAYASLLPKVQDNLSPTLLKLKSFKRNPEPRTIGNPRVKLSKALAQRFCDILSSSSESVFKIIADNPQFPSFNRLYHWQQRVPWFNAMWKEARHKQAEFLAQQCLTLYNEVTPKTAHVARVRFDIIRFLTAKFHPEVYGDKPSQAQSTTVNVGVSISPERLNDIRLKLDHTRSAFVSHGKQSRTPCQSSQPSQSE
jgi:hypothetical protein